MHSEQPPTSSTEERPSSGVQQIPLSPFAIQLKNIFPIEIETKRFPIDKTVDMATIVAAAQTQLNLGNLGIDPETSQAEAYLEVHVTFPQEPRLFEIHFKLIGIFSYAQGYAPEIVQHFLQQGSLSIMLPSARELLLSLCTRLQVPMVVLPLIQLTLPMSSPGVKTENAPTE